VLIRTASEAAVVRRRSGFCGVLCTRFELLAGVGLACLPIRHLEITRRAAEDSEDCVYEATQVDTFDLGRNEKTLISLPIKSRAGAFASD